MLGEYILQAEGSRNDEDGYVKERISRVESRQRKKIEGRPALHFDFEMRIEQTYG